MQRRDPLSTFDAAESITSQVMHSDATMEAKANHEMRSGPRPSEETQAARPARDHSRVKPRPGFGPVTAWQPPAPVGNTRKQKSLGVSSAAFFCPLVLHNLAPSSKAAHRSLTV